MSQIRSVSVYGCKIFIPTGHRSDSRALAIREITQFMESSMLRLIGAWLRPERSHRLLPKELQQLLQLQAAIIGPC